MPDGTMWARLVRMTAAVVLILLLLFFGPILYWYGMKVSAYFFACPSGDTPEECWNNSSVIVRRRMVGE